MKKLLTIAGIIMMITALMVGAFRAGVHHAMVDSEFWILEFDDAGPYDYNVHVLIDDHWYMHGIYVG